MRLYPLLDAHHLTTKAMASTRANPRKAAVGTAAWIAEERSSVQQWTDTEAEGFTFAAHNEVEWLNEHMAEIFSQNQSYVNKPGDSTHAHTLL